MKTEMVGAYKITPMQNGLYSVSLTNGKMGAFVTDAKGLEEFKAKYNRENDTVEVSNKKSSKGKKLLKGFASAYLPGLGQIADGRWKDGLKDMGKWFGFGVAGTAVGLAGYMNFVKATQANKTPYGFYAAVIGCAALGAGYIANWIHSIKDAYKKG